MDKENIIKGMDDLAIAKKNHSLVMKLIIGFSAVVVMGVLVWAFSVVNAAMGKILVVDKGGEYMKTKVEDNKSLFVALLTHHCAMTSYYTNSFDRNSIKENQAKAAFLASNDNLKRIFAMYVQQKAYGDALDRGVTYKCEFKELLSVKGEQEPYLVTFSSILTIYDVYNTKKILITSSGEVIRQKVKYPENVTGFYFKNYTQEYQTLEMEE